MYTVSEKNVATNFLE